MDKYRPSEKPFLCSVSLAYRSLDQVGNGNNDDDSLLHGRDTHIRSDEVTSLWSARFFLWRTKPNGWDDVLLWTHSYSSNHARFADGQQAGRSVRISVLFVLHDPAPLRVLWHCSHPFASSHRRVFVGRTTMPRPSLVDDMTSRDKMLDFVRGVLSLQEVLQKHIPKGQSFIHTVLALFHHQH